MSCLFEVFWSFLIINATAFTRILIVEMVSKGPIWIDETEGVRSCASDEQTTTDPMSDSGCGKCAQHGVAIGAVRNDVCEGKRTQPHPA